MRYVKCAGDSLQPDLAGVPAISDIAEARRQVLQLVRSIGTSLRDDTIPEARERNERERIGEEQSRPAKRTDERRDERHENWGHESFP